MIIHIQVSTCFLFKDVNIIVRYYTEMRALIKATMWWISNLNIDLGGAEPYESE